MVSLNYLNSHLQSNVFPFPLYRKSVGIFGKVVTILTRHARNVCVSCHDCRYSSLPSTAYADANSNKIATVALRDYTDLTCIQNTTRFNGILGNVILYTPIRNKTLPVKTVFQETIIRSHTEFLKSQNEYGNSEWKLIHALNYITTFTVLIFTKHKALHKFYTSRAKFYKKNSKAQKVLTRSD